MKYLALTALFISLPAFAGSWAYGCLGTLKDGTRITFNRQSGVMMAGTIAQGKIPSTSDGNEDEIMAFNAKDNNAGFTKMMAFENKIDASSSISLTLAEKSSKVTSKKSKNVPCTGGRERDIDATSYSKSYDFEVKYSTEPDPSQKGTVEMKCWENTTSACG